MMKIKIVGNTEVYSKEAGKGKMGSLTFSHLLRPVKMTHNK
jgi:hypothetical protein